MANLTLCFTQRGTPALLLQGLPPPLHCLWSDHTELFEGLTPRKLFASFMGLNFWCLAPCITTAQDQMKTRADAKQIGMVRKKGRRITTL